MLHECIECKAKYETKRETGWLCSKCLRAYRIKAGIQKPEGWVRKTADKNEYARNYRKAHPEKYAVYEKTRVRPDDHERRKYERRMKRLHGEDYVVGSPANKKHGGGPKRVLTPEEASFRHSVRRKAQRAVRAGKLVRHPCSVCGEVNSEAHHHDYFKPFDVIWLCQTHHREAHKSCNTL